MVSATNALGGRAATEHLLSLGHRRIGVITGVPDWLASAERLTGYKAALASVGTLPDPTLFVESDWAVDGGEVAAAALLDRPEPPTAIFAFNDNMAVGVLRAAGALGLRVPEDLSVVGFDDSGHASTVTPALTTVRQTAGRDGTHGSQPALASAPEPACRGATHRVGDAPRRARLHRCSADDAKRASIVKPASALLRYLPKPLTSPQRRARERGVTSGSDGTRTRALPP
jgi:hypothetical protein